MCSSAKNSQFHVVSQGNASSYAATTGSRSSHQRCSVKQGVHKFHRETPVLESFFDKVAGLQVRNFIKKRLQQSYFPVKFVKFLKAPMLKNIGKRLLLWVVCFTKQSLPNARVMIFITFKSHDKTCSKI